MTTTPTLASRSSSTPDDAFLAYWTSIETALRKSLIYHARRDTEQLHALLRTVYEAGNYDQPSSARSDKDAEREAQHNRIVQRLGWLEEGRDVAIHELKRDVLEVLAAKAQESAPSSERIATWKERSGGPDHLGLYPDAFFCMQDEIADLRAALARRAIAGTTAAPADVCAEMRALCSACGGTGDVHSIDGEWRGSCDCEASEWSRATAGNAAPTELAELAAKLVKSFPSRLSEMHCDGEPVGKKLIAVVDRLASNAATAAPGDLPPLPNFPEADHVVTAGLNVAQFWLASTIGRLLREYGRACIASNAGAAIPEGWKIPRESNDKLIAFARCWKLDGDWLTCKGCKRSLIASRDGEELNHAAGCKLAAEQHPWAQLRELVTKRAPSNPPAGATQEQTK